MSDKQENIPDRPLQSVEDSSVQIELLRESIRLEDRRLDVHNQRTQLAARALELSSEQDRRHADYLAEKLASRERADIRRHSVATRTLFGSFACSAIILGLLIGLAFFGSPEQSKAGIEALRIAGTGLGGFGIGYALLSVFRWLRQ